MIVMGGDGVGSVDFPGFEIEREEYCVERCCTNKIGGLKLRTYLVTSRPGTYPRREALYMP